MSYFHKGLCKDFTFDKPNKDKNVKLHYYSEPIGVPTYHQEKGGWVASMWKIPDSTKHSTEQIDTEDTELLSSSIYLIPKLN